MRTILLSSLAFFVTTLAFASDVIDLGKTNVEGAVRGPEIQVVEPNRSVEESADAFVRDQLSRLEERYLQAMDVRGGKK